MLSWIHVYGFNKLLFEWCNSLKQDTDFHRSKEIIK
jgi:hypothetical protein